MQRLLMGLFIVCLFPLQARADQILPEVQVRAPEETGSLTVNDADEAKETLSRVPGGVDLIPDSQYKKGRVSTLQDALGYSPGVYAQPRFGSEESRLSIRGSGIQRTFHLRGIKLLQDGIPINQADGGGDFQNVDPLAARYIEVYRGANALEYGATTLGGAVNFVSPTGHDARALQGRFELGSFNYLRGQVSSGAVRGPADYYVSLSQFSQDGFRNHSEQNTRRLFVNAGIRPDENLETRFYVTLIDSRSKLPGSLTRAQMEANPKQANAGNVSLNQKRDYDYFRLANKTALAWDDQTIEAGVFWFRKDLFHPIFQVLDIVYNDVGGSLRYQNLKDLFGRRSIFTAGFIPVFGRARDTRSVNMGGNRGRRTADTRQDSYNLDFFVEEQFYALPRLAFIGGLQWTYASRESSDRFLSDGDNSGSPHWQAFSPRIGVRYEFTEDTQVFANFSRSFEPPSFGELSNVTGGGIRDLHAQRASTFEIGTRGERGRAAWDLAWYYSRVDDELLSLNDGLGNPLGTVNADDTTHQGVELGLSADLLQGLVAGPGQDEEKDRVYLRGIYNWSHFRFNDHRTYDDKQLPGIPEHFLRAELMYEHPSGIYFGPNLEWVFERFPVDMNNTLFAPRYALLGMKGGWRMKNGFSFFVEGRNLTNETYAATTGVIADARGMDSAQFFPGDGRSVYAGMEVQFG